MPAVTFVSSCESVGVESRSGAVTWAHVAIAPFPLPAHRTGRADFPHPALRPASSQGPRRLSHGEFAQAHHAELAEDVRIREPSGPLRRDLVPLDQEVPYARGDMMVDRAVGRRTGSVVEVACPAFQHAVQLDANISPRLFVAPAEDCTDPRLETSHALLRRTGAEIPSAGSRGVVGSEAVAEEVEALVPCIAQRSVRLVEAQPQAGHDSPRPRLSLPRG